MTKTTKFVLDLIDRTLAGKDQDSARELWDVLSALRGPDDDNDDVKMANTVPIRAAAFPKTAAKSQTAVVAGNRAIMTVDPDTQACLKASVRGRAYASGFHYASHIRKAHLVLGLDIDSSLG